jgi:hypothetical protein
MDHLFNIYSMIANENNSGGCVNPEKMREKVSKFRIDNMNNKWLLEIVYSFYNLGYENGKGGGKDVNK